ncbi:MAG: hypothetical protein GY780_01735 [bacterium]|nr:hypothetical protein [bacterium]
MDYGDQVQLLQYLDCSPEMLSQIIPIPTDSTEGPVGRLSWKPAVVPLVDVAPLFNGGSDFLFQLCWSFELSFNTQELIENFNFKPEKKDK